MAGKAGPYVNNDGLVFHFDTGNTVRSFKGEPTVNLVTNPTFLGTPNTQTGGPSKNWYFSGDTSATGFRFYDKYTSPIPLKFPDEGAVITTGPNGTTNRRIYYNGTVEPSTTYTLSYWLYSTSFGSISNYFFTYKADGTGTTSPSYGQGFTTGQWVFIQQSFTTPADTGNTRQVNWGPVVSAGTDSLFAMQRFQIEANTKATQFTTGTRSATQGLLDLTGKSTIDLTNVSFDSNAQIAFDGTNDYIAPLSPSDFRMGTNSFTLEAVVKQDITTAHVILEARGDNLVGYLWTVNYGGAGRMSLFYNDGISSQKIHYQTGDFSITSTQKYYHLVVKVDKGDNRIYFYINGEQAGNGVALQHTNSISPTGGDFYRIGFDRGGTPWNGEIAMFKHYNRALTASEVERNFNAVRSRFGI